MPMIRRISTKELKQNNAPRCHYHPFDALKQTGDYLTWDKSGDGVAIGAAMRRFMRTERGFPLKLELHKNGWRVTRVAKWPVTKPKRAGFGLAVE